MTISSIVNGEAGSSVRDKLNAAITQLNLGSVDTVADLTALDSAVLVDGQRVYVAAYDDNGHGGGWFRWDAASTTATDGGITFIPDDLTTAASPYSLVYGHFAAADLSRQLPHTNIVWGSVAISIQDGAQTIGSKWLHGHAVNPRHGTGTSPVGRDVALLDHATGKVWSDNATRIRRLLATNTGGGTIALASRTAALNYRYATGAGRWVREIGDYVTPAMFGGVPDDDSFDNSFFTAWALNYLNSQDRVKTLKLDGNYTVKGFWAEVYSGIKIVGQGKEIPAITFMGDQGGGTGGVADFLKEEYIGSSVGILTVDENTDPYYLLDLQWGGAVQFSNATGWCFEDLCIDGNAANNLYFLDNVGGAWDVTPITGRVSAFLRESPTMAGFSVTVHNGRSLAQDTRWEMNRCTIKNMLGGCIVYANGGFMNYSDLRLGNSVSGRVLYGGQGFGRGLTLFGYTRSSFWAPYSGHFSDVIWEDAAENPWPDNAIDPEYFVMRSEDYRGQSDDAGYSATVQERYGHRHLTLSGYSIDMTDLPSTGALRHTGGRMDVAGGKIIGPTNGSMKLLDQAGQTGGFAVTVKGATVLNQSSDGIVMANANTSGFWAPLRMENIRVEENYGAAVTMTIASPAVFTCASHGLAAGDKVRFYTNGALPTGLTEGDLYYVIAAGLTSSEFQVSTTSGGSAVNTSGSQSGAHKVNGTLIDTLRISDPNDLTVSISANYCNLNMDPHPGGDVPPCPVQVIEFADCHVDTLVNQLVLAEGGGNASAQPTEVHFRGGSAVTRQNKLVKSVETDVTFSTRLKIFLTDFAFDLFDPGETGRGTADVCDPWIARTIMRNCRGRTSGKVSEIDAVESRTAVAGTTVTMTIASPGVVTWTGHGLAVGDPVQFANSGGALPTGVTQGELYYVVSVPTSDTFTFAKIAGGTAINTSGSQSGTHTACKAATERLTAAVNASTYIEIPINLMWKPMTYDARALSANAVTRGITSVTVAYPNTTGAVADNTRPRLRIGVDTVTTGDVLTYNLRAAVAPPRAL